MKIYQTEERKKMRTTITTPSHFRYHPNLNTLLPELPTFPLQ